MKRFLLFSFLLLVGFIAKSQVYNPSLHTVSAKAYGPAQAVPTDARSMYYNTGTFTYRPYTSLTEVMSYLNTPIKRTGGFDIFLTEGSETKVYWFKDGTDLAHLVLKVPSSVPKIKTTGNGTNTEIVGDSTQINLGGDLNKNITHLYLPVGMKTDQNVVAPSKSFVISNRTLAQGLASSDWNYWNQRGNNSLLTLERMFYENENDTAYQQYNGIAKAFSRMTFDRNSTRFSYLNKAIIPQEQGINAAVQIYFPQDSVNLVPSPFGRSGAALKGTSAYGDFYGYNIAIIPTVSNYPLSSVSGETDFNRVIDDTYRKKMTGPITNFLGSWKAHQANIGAGTTEAGSRYEQMTDFYSLGTLYPNIGTSVDKDKVLRVSRVDNAYGFVSMPKWLTTNEVYNGYGFNQRGVNDANHYEGWNRWGGTRPTRSTTLGDPQTYRNEFYGKVGIFDSTLLRSRVHNIISDTSGTGNVKTGVGTTIQRQTYFLDQNYTQNALSASRVISDWYVRDTLTANTSLNGISTMPSNETRLVIRALTGGVASKPVIRTNGGIKAPAAVNSNYLMLGSVGLKKLEGYWAGYVSGVDTYNVGDTITNFMAYSANNGNVNSGRIVNNYSFYTSPNTSAINDFGFYQAGTTMTNTFEGSSLFNTVRMDTARVEKTIPLSDSTTRVPSTGWVKQQFNQLDLPFLDSLQNNLISDSTYQRLVPGLTGNYDTVYTYYKVYPSITYDSTRAFLVPKYQNTGLITQGTNVTITGSGTTGDPYVISATGGGGGGITALTGDVTASGSGSVAATIANNAVTTTKINDGAVTASKIGDAQVSTLKLQDNSVTTAKIADNQITNAKIPTNTITPNRMNGGAEGQVVKYVAGNKTWSYEDFDMVAALSDETTALTTGVKLTFRAPSLLMFREARLSLTTASSSGTVSVTITVNGSALFTTALTVDASEKTSMTAAVPYVFSGIGAGDDEEIVVTISGAGTGATGAKLYLKGYKMSQ